MGEAGDRSRAATGGPVRPGALTALLADLARAPEAAGWELPIVPGETFARFEIVREVGRGGFGVVYEAKDTELGRCVAFKAIRVGSSDAAREQRTLAEAEAAARLAHPNIVHLYDVGRCDRGAFLIMELLRGESLDERLERGPPLKLREAVHVASEIARGLAHAHEQGVVHRDLKPGNVFLCDDGQVKVLDFGLAHVFGRRSLSGGTPAYMAPEQARGEPSDERADVYALGVILHELVTGERPFDSGAHGAARSGPPELPGAPATVAKLVARTLAADPADRPASAVEVLDELAAIREALAPRRALWVAASIATAAVVGAGLFAWSWQRPLPPGRLLAAIADTENASGERDLDGVSELLRTTLESSPRLSIVARSRLINVLREAGPLPRSIDAPGARRAALATGARILIIPEVRHTNIEYQLTAEIVDLAGGGTATADLYRGEILSELGRDPEAVEAFESVRRGDKSGALDEWVWLWAYPRALHLEASALARLGKRSEAQALNERLLHLWNHADPDHPLLREARALRARLASGRPL